MLQTYLKLWWVVLGEIEPQVTYSLYNAIVLYQLVKC